MVKDKQKSRERKVTLMLMLMIMAFLMSWSPYAIICIMRLVFGYAFLSPTLVAQAVVFAKGSVVWNPVFFIFLNSQVMFDQQDQHR